MKYSPRPCPPPKPPQHQGVLLPSIVAHERLPLSKICTELCLHPLPECTCGNLCLTTLWADSCQVEKRCCHTDACGHPHVHLTIPVQAQLCDHCQRCTAAYGEIETEAALPYRFSHVDGCTLFIQPHVQLLCAENTCERNVFKVQLSIVLDVYLLRLEPCLHRPCRPSCPQLPLYPPPMC